MATTLDAETVLNNFVQKNFLPSSPAITERTLPKTFIGEISYWILLASRVNTQITLYPDMVAPETPSGSPSYPVASLPHGWVVPRLLVYTTLISALNSADVEAFKQFKADLFYHYESAKVYRSKIISNNVSHPSIRVYGQPSLGESANDSYKAVDNMYTLWSKLDKIWELVTKTTAPSGKEPGIKIVTDGTPLPPGINKQIIYRPDSIMDIYNPGHKYGNVNPPAHKSARTTSPMAYMGTVDNKGFSDATNSPLSTWNKDALAVQKNTDNELGFMYQDAYNTNSGTNSKTNDGGYTRSMKDLYAFQFMYNPTSISYSVGSDPSIDWLGQGGTQGDVSVPMFGQGTVSFKLYINRIYDMGILRDKDAHELSSSGYGYLRTLKQVDIDGLLKRGTEYDLEFLYRVLNGTPYPSIAMSMGTMTSDYGLVFGLPIWVRFHNNLRYKCVVTGLNVNHVMFTRNMIPMFTEVDITLQRIPVITWDQRLSEEVVKSWSTATTTNQDSTQ